MLLGKGTFAKVFIYKDDTKVYAAKRYNSGESGDEEVALFKEIGDCDNIVKCHGIKDDMILFELLDITLERQLKYMKQHEAINAAVCILNALKHLHAKKIMHCDLKPDNIMCKQGVYKLIDFGSAVHTDTEYFSTKYSLEDVNCMHRMYIQNIHYRSPEAILGKKIGPASDVWAFGCILYEMLTGGDVLFNNQNDGMSEEMYQIGLYISILGMPKKQWLEKQKYARRFFSPDLSLHRYHYLIQKYPLEKLLEDIPPPFKKILKKIFVYDAIRRPTVDGLLKIFTVLI